MSMKRYLPKGFTLIELLIVIAVLGILAVAVLAAINPIEQINRSNDTGSRSDAEQLLSAIDRFYTANGYYPWQTAPVTSGTTPDATAWGKVDSSWTDGAATVLSKLSAQGTAELKESFINRIVASTYNTLYKFDRGQPGDSLYICFPPKSANFNTQSWNRCGKSTSGTGLPSDLQDNAATICVSETRSWSCLP